MSAAAPEFVPWPRSSPLLDAIGSFQYDSNDPTHMRFLVEGPKLNARGMLHAGVIGTIADVAIGHTLAGLAGPDARFVTVHLSCDLVGSAKQGEWVDITITPTKIGRRLAGGTATFWTNSDGRADRTVAIVSALFMPSAPNAA